MRTWTEKKNSIYLTAAAAKISSREIVIQKERKVPRDRLKERGYKFSVEPSKQPLHLTK